MKKQGIGGYDFDEAEGASGCEGCGGGLYYCEYGFAFDGAAEVFVEEWVFGGG